jgi:hypothetical protein
MEVCHLPFFISAQAAILCGEISQMELPAFFIHGEPIPNHHSPFTIHH